MKTPKLRYRPERGTYVVTWKGKLITLGTNEREAQEKYDDLIGGGMTIGGLKDLYLAWARKNLSESTVAIKAHRLDKWAASVGEETPANTHQPQKTNDWAQEQGNSSTTAKCLAEVSSLFNWAVKMGHVKGNPVSKLPRPKPKKRLHFIPLPELPEFLEKCRALSPDFGDFVTVQINTGARTQEMIRFKPEHWDGEKLTIHGDDSKTRDVRTVFVSSSAKAILEKRCGAGPDYLLTSPRGGKWSSSLLSYYFGQVGEKICGTTIRHSYAVAQLEKGVDPVLLAKLMGHANVKMIYETYGHLERCQLLKKIAEEDVV